MNRRSLLALFGGAAAMPAAIGVKSAASALGVETALLAPGPAEGMNAPIGFDGWYGSPLQIALEAKDNARYEVANGHAYPHMKSWGHGFRSMVAERDHQIRQVYRHKLQADEDFRNRVLKAIGGIA